MARVRQSFFAEGCFRKHASRLQCYRVFFEYINIAFLILLRFGVSCLQVLQPQPVGPREK